MKVVAFIFILTVDVNLGHVATSDQTTNFVLLNIKFISRLISFYKKQTKGIGFIILKYLKSGLV